jgi:hypothetical protein
MTPHVYSWASALGLWGTGDRVRISPITGGGGRWSGYTIPDPTFGTRGQGGFSPDLSGSPNPTPGVPPGYVWIGIERQPLSHRAPR